MMPDISSTLPAQLQRSRTSRRSRPSLAAFTDSGYAPSSQPARPTSRHATLTRSNARNTLRALSSMREEAIADGSDPFDLNVASQLTEESFTRERTVSFLADQPPTIRSLAKFDGEDGTIRGGTVRKLGTAKLKNNTPTPEQSNSGSSQYPQSSTISRSATISSAWSCVSNRLFADSLRNTGSEDDQRNQFIDSFDKLAKKHGIQPFPKKISEEPGSVSVSSPSAAANSEASTPTLSGNKFLNMLLRRTASAMDVSKHHGSTKLTKRYKRSTSVNDLDDVGRGRRNSLKGMHLEDMIRLGGVAIFNLPLGLSPGTLLIPTCMHSAASYILNNGIRKQGIFRVSGNVNTTFALYDFYQRQLEESNHESVVATTALARLPTHIHYNVHDVAHLLKKLIYGLPGGLLGSPHIFQALYNVHTFVYPDPSLGDEMTSKVKPRMIALAISSINQYFRITVICAVFGLLRAINLASEQETESKVKDPHETFVQMREDSLGTVFAPLLLGDKSRHILVDEADDRGGLLILPTLDSNGHASLRKSRPELRAAKKEAERMRRAAIVAQMMIDSWEDISYEMKKIDTLGVTAQAYDLPKPLTQNTLRRDSLKHAGKAEPQRAEYVFRPELKKFSTVRSTQFEDPLFSDNYLQSHGSTKDHWHSSIRSQKFDTVSSQPPIGDLLRFDSHKSNRKALDRDLFVPPPELGMPPIAESTTSCSISTSTVERDPEDTPNWISFSNSTPTKLGPPFQQELSSSPNWRNITTSTQAESVTSPNWHSARVPSRSELQTTQSSPNWCPLQQTPSQSALNTGQSTPNWRPLEKMPSRSELGTGQSTPNWRPLQESPSRSELRTGQSTPNWCPLQLSPNQSESGMSLNWRNIRTPSQVDTNPSPNWLQFPAPGGSELEGTPNWQLINTDEEGFLPDSPIRRLQIPYAEPEPHHEPDTPSSGTSSGAATPATDVTPQIAKRVVPEFDSNSLASYDNVVLHNSLAVNAPAEFDEPEPERRRPSIYGRRAISPVREVSLKKQLQEAFADHEDSDDYRPSTPKPLTFRRKPSSFSIFEDEPKKTHRGHRATKSVDNSAFPFRRPSSLVDDNITAKGKKTVSHRDLPEPSTRLPSNVVPLQPASPNRSVRATAGSNTEAEIPAPEKKTLRGGNTALYAEIRRLQRLVDQKSEEASHTRKELELAQNMAKTGTLSQVVRETQEELKMWKNRAEWAEQKLRQMGILNEDQSH